MGTWNDVLKEVESRASKEAPGGDIDGVRRDKMARVKEITGRELLVYATDFMNLQKVRLCQGDISIDLSDKEGFLGITRNVVAQEADVLVQSPGGSV